MDETIDGVTHLWHLQIQGPGSALPEQSQEVGKGRTSEMLPLRGEDSSISYALAERMATAADFIQDHSWVCREQQASVSTRGSVKLLVIVPQAFAWRWNSQYQRIYRQFLRSLERTSFHERGNGLSNLTPEDCASVFSQGILIFCDVWNCSDCWIQACFSCHDLR